MQFNAHGITNMARFHVIVSTDTAHTWPALEMGRPYCNLAYDAVAL